MAQQTTQSTRRASGDVLDGEGSMRRCGVPDLVALLVLLVGGAWVMRDPIADIVAIATSDEEAAHVLLVPIVVAWLLWHYRGRLRGLTRCHREIGPMVVVAGGLVSMFGYANAMQALFHAGALVALVGCVVSALGVSFVARLPAVFGVLVFAVPVPGMIRMRMAVPLQSLTAQATEWLANTCGIAVLRTGNVLSFDGTQVAVAEACNGVRMAFTLALVCYTVAMTARLSSWERLVLLLSCPLVAMVANVARLLPTLWLYGRVDGDVASQFHDISGYLMPAVALAVLLACVRGVRLLVAYRPTMWFHVARSQTA